MPTTATAKKPDRSRKPDAKRRGRPKGAKTEPRPTVAAAATACPKCGSTDRVNYSNHREQAHAGTDPVYGDYTHTVWRDTRCHSCGQVRTDRTREHRGGKRRAKN